MASKWQVGVAPIIQCIGRAHKTAEQKGTIWDQAKGQFEWKCADRGCLIKNYMSLARCRGGDAEFNHDHVFLCHPDGEPGVKQTHTFFPKMPKMLRTMKGADAERYKQEYKALPARKRDRRASRKHSYKSKKFDSSNARRARNRRPWWSEARQQQEQERSWESNAPERAETVQTNAPDMGGTSSSKGRRQAQQHVLVPINSAVPRAGGAASSTQGQSIQMAAIPITSQLAVTQQPHQGVPQKTGTVATTNRDEEEAQRGPKNKPDVQPVVVLKVKAVPKEAAPKRVRADDDAKPPKEASNKPQAEAHNKEAEELEEPGQKRRRSKPEQEAAQGTAPVECINTVKTPTDTAGPPLLA